MKKLLSFFAAGLLAVGSLGVMSCSGDLQDNDVQPLAIVGITNDPGNHVIPMTLDKPDGSEQSLKITFKDGFELLAADGKKYKLTDDYNGSWRQNNGNGPIIASRFKVIPPSAIKADGTPSFADDYGSLNGEDVQYLIAGETFSKVGRRGDKGVSGDPKHIVFDSVIAGETYILRAKYDSVKGSLELKLDGTADNPTEMKINIVGESKNFPAKDENKKDLTYTMNKAGKEYTYQFISVADETIEFNLSNPMSGTFYASSTEEGELELESAGKKNLSYDVKKNVEYKITVDLSSVLKPTIKAEIVDMLKDAEIYANWIYADNSYTEKIVDNAYQFIAKREEIDFTVVRHDGSVWGPEQGTSVGIDSDSVLLKLDSENSLKVKNLKVGSWYKIILEKDNDAFTLSAKVIQVPLADFTGMKFKGAFNGWNPAFDLTKQSDGSWTVDFEVTAETADFEFGIYGNGNDKWCHGESITVGNDFTKVEYAGGNAKIKGAEKGKSYTLIAKPGYGSIEVKIIEK